MTTGCTAFNRSKQKGAIVVFLALCMTFLLSLLAVVDIGFMYLTKREFQKAADLAALSGVRQLVQPDGSRSCAAATEAGILNAQTNLNQPAIPPLPTIAIEVDCGEWIASNTGSSFTPKSEGDPSANAVKAIVRGRPFGFFIPALFGNSPTEIRAEATSALRSPQAQLKIRTTLASLEDGIVNALLSSLLGGDVALRVGDWQSIADLNINLLDYFNQLLGVGTNVSIGSYQALLDSSISVMTLIETLITVAENSSSAVGIDLDVLHQDLMDLDVDDLAITLRDVLMVQTGTENAGLDAEVNVFDMVRAIVEVANKQNAIAISAPINIPGLAGVSLRATVVEHPQSSVIGNPELIGPNPKVSPNRIFIRTAGIRLLLTVDLAQDPDGSGPRVSLVNELQKLLSTFGLDVLDTELNIALNVGGGEAWVTGFSCNVDGSKSLDARAMSAAAQVSVGKLTAAQREAVFNPLQSFPSASPMKVLGLSLKVLGINYDVARVRLGAANLNVAGTGEVPLRFSASANPATLPDVNAPDSESMYQAISSQDILQHLSQDISRLSLQVHVLPGLIITDIVNALLNSVLSLVGALVGTVLSPLLDPILNALFDVLGLNLAEAEVGAKLSCLSGAVLVD